MPRPDYIALRIPAGYTNRIRRLADSMDIPVMDWVHRATRKNATGDSVVAAGPGSEFIAISRHVANGRPQGVIRAAIAIGFTDAERKAPRPPFIEQAEQQAAKGAIITDAMEDGNG